MQDFSISEASTSMRDAVEIGVTILRGREGHDESEHEYHCHAIYESVHRLFSPGCSNNRVQRHQIRGRAPLVTVC
jgi:hypothetical protein